MRADECSCCGRGIFLVQVDFHHWQYNRAEPGCYLCRDCHKHIHRGVKAGVQTRISGKSWKRDAVRRLLNLAEEKGLTFDSSEAFCDHFNIPDNVSKEQAETEFEKRRDRDD